MNAFLDHLLYNPKEPLTFVSIFFWIYFSVVLVGFVMLRKRLAIRNAYLFLISLYFYYKTSYWFVFLLLFSTGVDYSIGRALGTIHQQGWRKALVALSVTINLSVLFYFKYVYFFSDILKASFGIDWTPVAHYALWSNQSFGTDFVTDRIFLPVGISFYTFQCISYTVDVFRRRIEPVKSPLDFGFYISFFPQLVAGPIVRASDFIPQLYKPYQVTRTEFGLGLFWILNGLLKKVFLADYIALNFIDRVFAQPTLYTGIETALALIGYSLQVYADFSGYTDVAIGVALWMGFSLTKNFHSPYKATSVADFWKRWHMSLSGWLRDYVYIPLGGNRSGTVASYVLVYLGLLGVALAADSWETPAIISGVVAGVYAVYKIWPKFREWLNTNVNLMLTMLLGGIWHGASWNFVLWGGLNGLGLVFYKGWQAIRPYKSRGFWIKAVGVLLTFTFITFTRIWFRSPDLETAQVILDRMQNNMSWALLLPVMIGFWKPLSVMVLGYGIHMIPESGKQAYRLLFARTHWALQGVVAVLSVLVMYQVMTAESQPFIYFQF